MRLAPTRGSGSGLPLILSDRQGFDRRWFASNLQAVWTPTLPDQVALCVAEALTTYGRDVKIASGRHCYENFVYNNSVKAIIDMSALNQVGFDPERKAFFVDAGAENWTVYRTLLNGFGKTLPAGSCYSVGAGGHITGGGYGLLSRLHGLTVDYLTGVDIVLWDAARTRAELRYVSEASGDSAERDLFWALRGAGCGNFGVIVRYYFAELPDAPDYATLWTLAWNWADINDAKFATLLTRYSELTQEMPKTDFGLLHLSHSAQGQIGLTYQIASPAGVTAAEHIRNAEASVLSARRRFAEIATPRLLSRPLGGHLGYMSTPLKTKDAVHLTYLEALQTVNGSGPNRFGKYKSAYMKKAFPADQAEAIYYWLNVVPKGLKKADMTQSLLQVDSYGGEINAVSSTATPVPQRSSIMKLQYQTYWSNDSAAGQRDDPNLKKRAEAQARAHVEWINQFYAAVYKEYGGFPDPDRDPGGTVDGCYFNYPDVELGSHARGDVDHALRLYFLDNFRTNPLNLVAVKRHWDPQNYFHHAQSIPVT
jgi:FAD binding domain/Berberine and berberine like